MAEFKGKIVVVSGGSRGKRCRPTPAPVSGGHSGYADVNGIRLFRVEIKPPFLRAQLMQGFAWHVYPENVWARRGKGFHDHAIPPVTGVAEYLCDYGLNGFLILTEEPFPPQAIEDWGRLKARL